MADGAYKEIKSSLIRIEDKLGVHGEKLSAIDQHLIDLNGKVVVHTADINQLYKCQNEIENHMKVQQGRIEGMGWSFKLLVGLITTATGIIAILAYITK